MRIAPDALPIAERWLKSAEVAELFRVDPRTVARWARDGLIRAIRTPGGRSLLFPESGVRAALKVSDPNKEGLVRCCNT